MHLQNHWRRMFQIESELVYQTVWFRFIWWILENIHSGMGSFVIRSEFSVFLEKGSLPNVLPMSAIIVQWLYNVRPQVQATSRPYIQRIPSQCQTRQCRRWILFTRESRSLQVCLSSASMFLSDNGLMNTWQNLSERIAWMALFGFSVERENLP